MRSKNQVLIIAGHHPKYNWADQVKTEKILNKMKPLSILIEKGYIYEMGMPVLEDPPPSINIFARNWAKNNKVKCNFIDYNEPVDEGTSKKIIDNLREQAISKGVLNRLKQDFSPVVLLIGQDHLKKIKDFLKIPNDQIYILPPQ